MIVFWGFSVPTVAGKMVCFINPLTKLFSPPFWEKYLKSIFSIPSLNAAFPSVYAVANVMTILNCNGLIMSRIIGQRDGEKIGIGRVGG